MAAWTAGCDYTLDGPTRGLGRRAYIDQDQVVAVRPIQARVQTDDVDFLDTVHL